MLVTDRRYAHLSDARPQPRAVLPARLALAALLATAALPGLRAPALAETATPPAAADSVAHEIAPPADLKDLRPWLDYKVRAHVASLPHEARLFYRQGLLARERGQRDDAMRLVRGAAELDPSFVAPHLTLASWSMTREPSQSLLQYATVLDLARQNFMLQLALAANALYLGLQALFLGLLAAAMILVAVHAQELRHPWEEWLSRHLMPESARWWSWGFVVLPYAAGFGPVLPTLVFLGLLWPMLKVRERIVFVCLLLAAVSGPWTTMALSRMASPLHEDRGALYGVPTIANVPWSQAAEDRLTRLAHEHPDNPYVAFGLAWMARRGGHLELAETSYRRVLALWPEHDVALNNLGNAVAMQGRPAEALALYQRATAANPDNAAAWFNASQLYTQRFEYKSATDALSRASALDFEMVKTYQSQGTDDGLLPLVDQWVAPRTFWLAMSSADTRGESQRALPPSWRGRIEATGWPFTVMALLAAGLGLFWGWKLAKRMPLRACSNCGRVLCRRCAQRRREVALCPACAGVESRAESPEFARVLLQQYRRKRERSADMVRTVFATLIPGFGLLCYQRVITPVFLLTLSAAMLSGAMRMAPPFSYEPRLLLGDERLPLPLTIAIWAFLYAVSLAGYIHQSSRRRAQAAMIAAPTRSRSVQATRLNPPAAAA